MNDTSSDSSLAEGQPSGPGVETRDTLAEAARKTLRMHFLRMVAEESATIEGLEVEALHAMRVATRRMRAALRVFESYLDPAMVGPWIGELQRIGRRLGAVRDMDIFREKTEAYLLQTGAEAGSDLSPLMRAWDAAHTSARHALLDHLTSRRYRRFKRLFDAALTTKFPSVHPSASTVADLGEQLIRQRLGIVYSLGQLLSEPNPSLVLFHQLRIEVKSARYLLEFLQEVLGPEAMLAIADLRAIQDHLGNLQDAVVACSHIENVLTWGIWHAPRQPHTLWCRCPVDAGDVSTYLTYRRDEIEGLVATFPEQWQRLQTPDFAQALNRALRVR